MMKTLKTYNQLFESYNELELNLINSFRYDNNFLSHYLIDNGDPSYIFKNYHVGSTLITFAIEYRDFEKLKLLIDYGGDVNHIDEYGDSYLLKETHHFIADLTIISMLIEANANWNIIEISTGKDFFEKLDLENKRKIKDKYPEKYQKYLKNKKAKEFNL